MSHRYTLTALAVASLFAQSAQSAPSGEPEIGTVIVTATRQPQRANEALADVSIVTREDIEKAGQSTLGEILAAQPGLEMAGNGGYGVSSDVYIRGGNAGHTLVLIDGLRLGSSTLGTTNFGRIPVAQIDHIEILRGPASALYGSDAIGGVIQIFTRKGNGAPKLSASAGYGSYNTREATAGVSAGDGKFSYSINAAQFLTDGFAPVRNSSSPSYDPSQGRYDNKSVAGSAGYRLNADQELAANYFFSTGTNHYNSQPVGFDFRDDHAVGSFGINWKSHLTRVWQSTVKFGHGYDASTDYTKPTLISSIRTDQDQFGWQNDFSLPVGKALVALEDLRETASSPAAVRDVKSVLMGWSGKVERNQFQLDLRRDQNSQYGTKTTGLVAYGLQFTTDWRGSMSYGTAFKAPTLNALYFNGPGGISNPNLRPESARNREVSVFYDSLVAHASLTAYNNSIKDLIDWADTGILDPSYPPSYGITLWSPSNVNSAKLRGLTAAYSRSMGVFAFNSSADYQDPRDSMTNKLLPHRSRAHGKLGLDYNNQQGQLGAEVVVSGTRYDDAANTRRLGGYGVLNLYGSYRLGNDWSLFGRVNNVLDKYYELSRNTDFYGAVTSYATPGANLFVGVRYAPK